jgi:hypothetical protein
MMGSSFTSELALDRSSALVPPMADPGKTAVARSRVSNTRRFSLRRWLRTRPARRRQSRGVTTPPGDSGTNQYAPPPKHPSKTRLPRLTDLMPPCPLVPGLEGYRIPLPPMISKRV